jgi:putative peptidoglycan lipid II flippase
MANGLRQICLLLIPSAILMAVLAEPITRLVYQRGAFGTHATDLVSTAMVWWSISLPFQGVSLLFSRTFFSLQKPWLTTWLSGANLVVNAAIAAALHGPLGLGGIVLGTVVGTIVMCVAQGAVLRQDLGGIEGRRTVASVVRMLIAGALLAGAAYGVWALLRAGLGVAQPAQAIEVGGGILAGLAVYAAAVWVMKIPEAQQIRALMPARLGGG